MIKYLRETGCYSESTLTAYQNQSKSIMRIINMFCNEPITPYEVKPEHITKLVDYLRSNGFTPNTQNTYIGVLHVLLNYCDNPSFKKVFIVHQHDTRPTADWLTLKEGQELLDYPFGPAYKMFIWLGLCHGLRRVEITRLNLTDIDMARGIIRVTGKGRGGGKLRIVPTHPNFKPILDTWMVERKQITEGMEDIDSLMVYKKKGKVRPYTVGGLTSAFDTMRTKLGISFTSHTLRRTFGRELWLCGVSLETISMILGHESTMITIRYLGINLDDMASAMSKLSLGK